MKDVEKSVADLVMEGFFANFGAAKQVITEGVEEWGTVADATGAAKGSRKDRKAEFALEEEGK